MDVFIVTIVINFQYLTTISWIINTIHSLKVIHAHSGIPYETMGLMQGKVVRTSLIVIDSFALPMQETRVNPATKQMERVKTKLGLDVSNIPIPSQVEGQPRNK